LTEKKKQRTKRDQRARMLLIKEMIRAENNNREKSDKKPIKGGIARLLGGELGGILEFCHTKSRVFGSYHINKGFYPRQ
jgi:hypothetical protein